MVRAVERLLSLKEVQVEPQLGWVWLSQKERRTAEQALADLGPDGTRDELGFSIIHFGYADRFFPGTSVQHTNLRYIWFVCWSYLELQHHAAGEPFPKTHLDRIEDRTGQRLLRHYGHGDGHGIIGGRVLRVGRSPVVKPSAVYWNAMRSWGLVEPIADGRDAPGRAELHGRWQELTGSRLRPELDAEPPKSLFFDPPEVPSRWRTASEPLTFELDSRNDEAGRIRRAWRKQGDSMGRQTLLSRLADRDGASPRSLTSRAVLDLCHKDEKISLRRAQRAGALAAVSRAIHTALVQRMKDPGGDQATIVRQWLDEAVELYGASASELDVPGLLLDVREANKLVTLIEATQSWLKSGAGGIGSLDEIYRRREESQKPGRALLARSSGDRRANWRPRPSGPLTYRWEKVAGFLDQLEGL
jgi:hypothetical protein